MALPFTEEQFFAVFARYNTAVWPAQVVLGAAAVWACWALAKARFERGVLGLLAALWLWMALVYHLGFFRAINQAASIFAALFVVAAGLFARAATSGRDDAAGPVRGPRAVVGWCVVGYALAGYPLLGLAAGQRYPAFPAFGLPCPTTLFTLGALLLVSRTTPRTLFAVPLVWAAVGTSAALRLGVVEDLGLAVAAVSTVAVLMRRPGGRSERHPASGVA